MSYTYDEFVKSAQDSGLFDQFSDYDLKLAQDNPDAGMALITYKRDYANAPTDEARALINDQANQLRSSYGNYTGGSEGGSYYLQGPTPKSYADPYTDERTGLLNKVVNREPFAWNQETDPSYQASPTCWRSSARRWGRGRGSPSPTLPRRIKRIG